jgi:hypothetical protein
MIIGALATGATYGEAARRAGVSSKTVQRRMSTPAFRAELERVESQTIAAITERLQAAGELAIETFITLCRDDNPRIQLAAAQAILRAIPRYVEVAESQRGTEGLDEVLPTEPEFDREAAERGVIAAMDEVASRRKRGEEFRHPVRGVDER